MGRHVVARPRNERPAQHRVVYGQTKTEVQGELKKLQRLADDGLLTDLGSLTVAQFLEQWLAAAGPTLAKGTINGYRQHVNNMIVPKLGAVRLAKLNALQVQGMLRTLTEEGYSTAMQRKARITLGVALEWAVQMKLLVDNVARRVTLPIHRKPEVKALEAGQVADFLKAAKEDRLYALYPLALDSGCRQGEMLGLTWADVNFDRGTVAVVRSLEEVGGRAGAEGTENRQVTANHCIVSLHPFRIAGTPQSDAGGRQLRRCRADLLRSALQDVAAEI